MQIVVRQKEEGRDTRREKIPSPNRERKEKKKNGQKMAPFDKFKKPLLMACCSYATFAFQLKGSERIEAVEKPSASSAANRLCYIDDL